MSFILDALKKSENDRQRQASPALFEVKVATPRRRFPVWALGLGVLLAINIGVLAWLALRGTDGGSSAAVAPAAAPAAPPATANTPLNAAATTPGEVTVPATVTFQMNVPVNATGAVPAPQAPEPGVVADSSAPPLAVEPRLSNQDVAIPPDYDSRDYLPAMTPEQAGALAAARRAETLPSRDQMLASGARIPDLRLDLHVYDNDAAKRFVFINMRKLREGESLPEGVRVEEITRAGARLSYQGSEFALSAN